MKAILPLFAALLLSACVQENNPRNLRLGDVTLGAQLIDLKAALEASAIDHDEYEKMKRGLVNAASMCTAYDEEEPDEEDDSWLF